MVRFARRSWSSVVCALAAFFFLLARAHGWWPTDKDTTRIEADILISTYFYSTVPAAA